MDLRVIIKFTALREAQKAFAGEAERIGLKNDDDVMAMIKQLREEGVVK